VVAIEFAAQEKHDRQVAGGVGDGAARLASEAKFVRDTADRKIASNRDVVIVSLDVTRGIAITAGGW